MNKLEAGALANDKRIEAGLTWEEIATAIEKPPVWTVAAVLGSHPMPAEEAKTVASMLGLDTGVESAFRRQPVRSANTDLVSDPTVYRFYELIQVYGAALKELIHEEFGDGIMSAINCKVDVARREDPAGDRVVVTIDGKFLNYQW